MVPRGPPRVPKPPRVSRGHHTVPLEPPRVSRGHHMVLREPN